MCRALFIFAMLLPLAGCYVPPGQPDPYGYVPPYAAYQADPDAGYVDNGGAPYMYYEGSRMPLIVVDGAWGFYDRDRRFHRAPDSDERNRRTFLYLCACRGGLGIGDGYPHDFAAGLGEL